MKVNVSSQIGWLRVEVENESLVGVEFGKIGEVSGSEREKRYVEKVIKELNEYLAGERREFDLNLKIEGTEFQKKVWREMMRIPYGEKISYLELARRINSKAVRAVGSACGANKLPIVIPCHRIIRSDGGLGGYGGGLEIKEKLLGLERH